MKIGIMGGTFNPIHNGHLVLASAAKEAAGLDEVWFMPSGLPAHKSNDELLPADLRLAMVKLAIADMQGFLASSFEIDRPGFTYTANTLQALKEEYPKEEFFFIIGGDSLMKFHHWVRPDIISAHATLLATGRDDVSREELQYQADRLHQLFGTKIRLINMPRIDFSSRKIRACLSMQQFDEMKDYVPEAVYQFMMEHKLFQKNRRNEE